MTSLAANEQHELYEMVKAIYHHLGLDGQKIVSIQTVKEQARKDALKWRERHSKKEK